MASNQQGNAAAEQLFANGSYQKAHDAYAALDQEQLSAAEKRWTAFRLADTEWRAAAAGTEQSGRAQKAMAALQKLVDEAKRQEDHDRVWAEAQESLGDFHWVNRAYRNWYQAWSHYQAALDWWAGADVDVEQARSRYLAICWRAARPPGSDLDYYYGYYGNQLPLEVLANLVAIAKTPDDLAHAHFLHAMGLRNLGGDYEQIARVASEFEAAQSGKKSEWSDEALYNYAQYLESQGKTVQTPDGNWTSEPDYVGALALYRRFLNDYKKGESRWVDEARSQAEQIVAPQLTLSVSNVFLPGSLLRYSLSWRNVPKIDLTLYQVDLGSAVSFRDGDSASSWLERLERGKGAKVRSWSKDTHDKGDYRPGSSQESLETLPTGAYLLEAQATGRDGKPVKARDLVLITQSTIVVKTASNKAVLFICDAVTGAPKPKAKATLFQHYYRGNNYHWKSRSAVADENGLAEFPLNTEEGELDQHDLFATASAGDEQAFATAYVPSGRSFDNGWKIYAFTDRPAYRPGDKAQWKVMARVYQRETYETPANKSLSWEITDPQGAKIAEGTAKLNAFGSAWGEVALTDKMPLGEYRISFTDPEGNRGIGGAVLLRLEEYKLPEFTVAVKTPLDESGHRKSYRLGDKVTAEVQVDYYFGGAVTGADVQLLVYQTPYYPSYQPERSYPWFYEDMHQGQSYYGGGSVIRQEQLKTDATGKAQITFDTPRGAGVDYDYRVEARVTDSSRREVTGSGNVRVTRQKFFAYLTPSHSLFQPKDKVTVAIKTLDANGEPYPAEGTIAITRDRWFIHPDGSGYEHEDIETRTVKTDAKGEGELIFTPEKDGYYRLVWTTPESGRNPVRAEATVWVMREGSADIGYRQGGVEILLDKDTVAPGATVPVMISVPANDRWVFFSQGSDLLDRYEVLHMTGTSKLVMVTLDEKSVPNVFLQAQMVHDSQVFEDMKQVIVPPLKHYLSIDIQPDRKEYQARDEGQWIVHATDDQGKPVAAEVALGVVDESIYSIQSELAEDPRQFYFGQKRAFSVQTQSSFNQKIYAKILATPEPAAGVVPRGGSSDVERFHRSKDAEGSPAPMMASLDDSAGMALAPRSAAAPAPVMAEAAKKSSSGGPPAHNSIGGGGGGEPAVVVRTDFRATAFWGREVVTGADGSAKVSFKYPDSLTTWRATARAQSATAQFGIATSSVKTRMPLLVRLQGPRFFVVNDETVISGVANNNTGHEIRATLELAAAGLTIEGEKGARSVTIPPGGEARADWKVRVEKAGEARLKVTVRGGGTGDAMEKSFPIYEHGIDKLVAKSGKVRGDSVLVKLAIPHERREGSTQLSVQVAPSMAITMLDALPYLIDYPYGCTEQTMSRFLPAAIVKKTLGDLGLDAGKAMSRAFGGIEAETANKTHPEGKHELKDLGAMTQAGLARLYDFQRGDGGWGWWKESQSSDRYMTAYVLWGLSLARDGGIEVRADVLSRAANYLGKELISEKTNLDRQAWLLHALSAYYQPIRKGALTAFEKKAYDNLWANHKDMNAYTRALFALTAYRYGFSEQAKTLAVNLENGVERDLTPDTSMVMEGAQHGDASAMGTAHWGRERSWMHWSDSGVEATSFAILALSTIDPKSELLEPAVNWLIKNRRGAQWSNTKDTAITVLALTQYLKTSGELGAPIEYALTVNGKEIARKKLTVDEALSAPSRFVVDSALVRDNNEIKLVRLSGTGPLYFSAEARFFSLEEPIAPAGNELFVRRSYFKLVTRKTLLKGFVYDRLPLLDGGEVQSGDRIEVVVAAEVKNDYEYLLFEDLKPAGFESVEVKSGQPLSARQISQASYERNYGKIGKDGSREKGLSASTDEVDYTGETRSIYVQLRDRQVALFADSLKQGVWEMRYELRAEVPGKFHALPLTGQAMYVPEIRGNSAEVRVEVKDKP